MADESSEDADDHQGQDSLVRRMVRILEQRGLRDAMRVLNDDDDDDEDEEHHDGGSSAADDLLLAYFRRRVNGIVLGLRNDGHEEHEIFRGLRDLVIRIGYETAEAAPDQLYGDTGGGGAGARAAPAAAATVLSLLEAQTFRRAAAAGGGSDDGGGGGGGVMECSICFEEFVDGAQVSVMPCPCRGHRFHPDCIGKWLGISNVCPLCRHELPAAAGCGYDQ